MSEVKHEGKFPGFPPKPITNFWAYPKALNGWWKALTPWEQKVLDYLLRHTWGYDKNADTIANSQFLHGIKRRDGTEVDGGTGIKDERTIRKALVGLEQKGFITKEAVLGKENIYRLRVDPSQEMLPPTSNVTTPPTQHVTGDPSHSMSPTIENNTIKNNNISPASLGVQKKSYKEIDEVISYLSTKLGNITFTNKGKQARYAKLLLEEYPIRGIKWSIDKMAEDPWWAERGFDLQNVADQIPKLQVKYGQTPKDRSRPKFLPCNQNGCSDGYIYVNSQAIVHECFNKYLNELQSWKEKYEK